MAVSVSVDGGTHFEYVGATKAVPGSTAEWKEHICIGEEAAATWTAKTKLKVSP